MLGDIIVVEAVRKVVSPR